MTPHIRLPHGVIKTPPPEFVSEFVSGGWRRVERLYGRRLISRWIAMSGGDALIAQRRAAMGRGVRSTPLATTRARARNLQNAENAS